MKLRMILFTAFIAGCSHGQVQLSSGATSTASGGTVISSSSAGLNVQASGSSAAALIGLGIIAAGMYDVERGRAERYRGNPFTAAPDAAASFAPELAPSRTINEQDCTKPFDYSLGNLRCK
jgi:hypothetical protein